ncbi:copper resistance protein B [Hydrogenimonas sp.]
MGRNLMKWWVGALILGSAAAQAGGMGAETWRATLLADRFEYVTQADEVAWDVSAYVGGDIDKLYLYSEGATGDETESENELLYSRAVTPFWDLQAGVELDQSGSAQETWGVVAIQGLAPYFIETRLRLKIGEKAVGVLFDFEYEALLTQRLILTPRLEMEAYSDDVPKLGIGSGFSSLGLGLRLRYEVVREFAPYVGVEYVNAFGDTKARYGQEKDTRLVMGLRFWF